MAKKTKNKANPNIEFGDKILVIYDSEGNLLINSEEITENIKKEWLNVFAILNNSDGKFKCYAATDNTIANYFKPEHIFDIQKGAGIEELKQILRKDAKLGEFYAILDFHKLFNESPFSPKDKVKAVTNYQTMNSNAGIANKNVLNSKILEVVNVNYNGKHWVALVKNSHGKTAEIVDTAIVSI